MDHEKARELFSDYVDGELGKAAARSGSGDERGAPGKHGGATVAELEQHLAACIQCRTELAAFRQAVEGLGKLKRPAPASFLPDIQHQIYVRSRGRFFGRRGKLFGRIPFEWLSLAMIIAMLVYYIVVLRTSPTGVSPAP